MEKDFSKDTSILNAPFLYQGVCGWPSYSPEGRKIAFTTVTDDSMCSISIIDVEKPSDIYSITDKTIVAKRSNWNRQGNRIVYNVNNETIWVHDLDSNESSLLISDKDRNGRKLLHPCYTPDGGSIIVASYERGGPKREEVLFRITPESANPIEEITRSPHVCAGRMTVSPDNSHVVFAGHAGFFYQAENRLWVKFSEESSYPLEKGSNAKCHGRSPSYSPDGNWIACVSARPMEGPTEETPLSIWIIRSDGKDAYKLTHSDKKYTHMAWSPDQTKMAATCAYGLQIIDLPEIFHK